MSALDYLGLAVVAVLVAELVMRHLGRIRIARMKERVAHNRLRVTR